jgi:oligosaccharide 4-alpha-D-glucosyltransferase
MKNYIVIALCLTLSVFAGAQTINQSYQASDGVYKVAKFAPNIFKITFIPQDYTRNEQISDVVRLKPQPLPSALPVAMHHDTLVLDGRFVIASSHHTGDYRGFRIVLHPGEQLFGGGERALPLNRRGYRFDLYNGPHYGYGEGAENLNYSVPVLTSSAGYGMFFDNVSKGYFDIGKSNPDVLEYGAFSGELNVYVILGDYSQVLHSYFKLTGTQPLPPRWAFGNLMSRMGYSDEGQVRGILDKMHRNSVRVDAVIFDLFWFGDSVQHYIGNLDWVNKTKWPDPARMINDFKRQGIQTILITEPYMVEKTKYYDESKPYLAVDSTGSKPYYLTQFYFGHGGIIDLFRKDSRDWFWKFYKRQMDIGVEAWWGDLGEPEHHPADVYHNLHDLGFNRLFSANEVHGFFGHTWTKMLYDKYAVVYPEKRLFSLNRSGYAGSQHYAIFPWTGDVGRTWSGLRAQLPVLLGMSMSGIPYVHSDAGGFAGGDGDNELYVRWMQFAVFTPIFRPHGTAVYDIDKNNFSFPSEAALFDEPYRTYARQAIDLRYAMLPYNYTLAYRQTIAGDPLISPLYYLFANDTVAARIQNEYMWGTSVLVAPVLEKGAKEWRYYLPQGYWYSPAEGKMLEGTNWYTTSCKPDKMNYFLREGSFIPMNATHSLAGSFRGDSLVVIYVPSVSATSYKLFNDDGQSKSSLRKKHYELITFRSGGFGREGGTIDIRTDHGNYPGKPTVRHITLRVPLAGTPHSVTVNGKPQPVCEELPTGSCRVLTVPVLFDGKPLTIRIH